MWVCPSWVDSRRLEKSYLESVPRSFSGQEWTFPETVNPEDAGFLLFLYPPK